MLAQHAYNSIMSMGKTILQVRHFDLQVDFSNGNEEFLDMGLLGMARCYLEDGVRDTTILCSL